MPNHLVLIFAALLAAAGCSRQPGEASGPQDRHVETAGSGTPARVTLSVSPTRLTTAQRVTVRLEAALNAGVELKDVNLAAALPEGLTVVDSRSERRATSADGASVVTREWTLEPFLAGNYEIGSISVNAAPRAEAESSPRHPSEPIVLKPIGITVESVLTSGDEDLAEAKSIVDPPPEPLPWAWIGLGTALALALIGLAAARLMRPKPPPPPVFIPAHELALRRLDGLMARGLVEAGRFKEFYEEASLILRRYIEDRFGLHAPERTTEEFLEESRTSAFLSMDDVAVLRKFLSHCDLVKFAAVVPSGREAEQVAATVREFVDRTRDSQKQVQIEPDAEATA